MNISIVVVAGPKRTQKLMALLRSVEKSTYKHYEIIVVDNSQNPHLKKIIKVKFPWVNYFCMPHNVGVLAYNIGLANAKGEYILTLDDDCTVRKETLAQIAAIFPQKLPTVGIINSNIYEPADKKFIYEKYLNNDLTSLCLTSNAAVFRKTIFSQVGYYDPDFFLWVHEDDLALRVLNYGYKIYLEPKIIVNHYPQNQQRIRKDMLFYWPRNLAWLNLKHFSVLLWPLLVVKNIISFSIFIVQCRSLISIPYLMFGYLRGWLSFYIPLKKRKVINFKIQLRYLFKYSLFSLIN